MSAGRRRSQGAPYLLDTHIWFWHLTRSDRLRRAQREAIDDSPGDLWLSPVSIWELGLLAARGRVRLEHGLRDWTGKSTGALPVRDAALTREVAVVTHELPFAHADPADRFLAATALVYELTLVTADARLRAARWLPTL